MSRFCVSCWVTDPPPDDYEEKGFVDPQAKRQKAAAVDHEEPVRAADLAAQHAEELQGLKAMPDSKAFEVEQADLEAEENEIAAGDATKKEAEQSPAEKAIAPDELPFQDKKFKEITEGVDVPPELAAPSQARRPSSVGVTMQAYMDSHAEDFKVLEQSEPMDGWVYKKSQDGVDIYTKQTQGSTLCSFKAITTMSAGSAGLYGIVSGLTNGELRPTWDDMCKEAKNLEKFVPFYGISHVKLQAPSSLISDRDFAILGRMRLEEDGGALVQCQSVEHKDAPETPGYVRGWFIHGGYIIRPTAEQGIYKVSWTGCVDPKGWLPAWVVNFVCWKQGLTLAKFKKTMIDK